MLYPSFPLGTHGLYRLFAGKGYFAEGWQVMKYLLIVLLSFCVMPAYPQIKILAVGDVMPGSYTPKEVLPPDGGKLFVNSVGKLLQSPGIVFGNLEGTFITNDMQPCKCSDSLRALAMCYEFGIPDNLLSPLHQLGFNVFNLENNHSRDYGAEGFRHTVSLLRNNNIQPVTAGKPALTVLKGDTICILGFSQVSATRNIANLSQARKVVTEAAQRYKHVIVSFHGGAEGEKALHIPEGKEEYLEEGRGDLRAFAHAVIDAGAHMVIGHGPHVLRAMELYKNKLIAYSLGNFLTYGNFNLQGSAKISCILAAELNEKTGDFEGGRIMPIVQEGRGVPAPDPKKRGITLLNQLMRSDIHPNKLRVELDGTIVKQ